ncbi:MAG: hypothetical protein ACRCYM_02990 [Cetobacterium sp.]
MVFKSSKKVKKKRDYQLFLILFISFFNFIVFNFNIYIDKEYDFHIPFFMQKIWEV